MAKPNHRVAADDVRVLLFAGAGAAAASGEGRLGGGSAPCLVLGVERLGGAAAVDGRRGSDRGAFLRVTKEVVGIERRAAGCVARSGVRDRVCGAGVRLES